MSNNLFFRTITQSQLIPDLCSSRSGGVVVPQPRGARQWRRRGGPDEGATAGVHLQQGDAGAGPHHFSIDSVAYILNSNVRNSREYIRHHEKSNSLRNIHAIVLSVFSQYCFHL